MLLNFNQCFASDADYTFFAKSVYEKHHSRSSIHFAIRKINSVTLTAGTNKSNFKETIERFVATNNAFSFMSSVKGTPAYWKIFFYDVLAMLKELGIPTYFVKLSCATLRCEELPYISSKLNNPVLVARHFQ